MIIGPAVLSHVAKHVVSGPIENPHNTGDLVGGQAHLDPVNNRNPTGYTGFIEQADALFIG